MARKPTVCFTALFDLTEVYLALEKSLREYYDIVWICPREREYRLLVDSGIAPSDVILLANLISPNSQSIYPIETKFTFCQIYLSDRFLSKFSFEKARNQMLCIQKEVKQFLSSRGVGAVFGEPVNATDLITVNVCKALDIRYFYPQVARIPSHRLVFEEFSSASTYVKVKRPPEEESDGASVFLEKPDYFHENENGRKNDKPLYFFQKLKNIFGAPERSYIRYSWGSRLADITLLRLKRLFLRRLYHFDTLDVGESFVFLPFHVQPELSIDVLSPVMNDQEALVSQLSRCVGDNVTIAVKPHSNFLESVPLSLLRRCRKHHNVKVIDPAIDSHDLIQRSLFTVTFSGTVAYESFFLRKPAIMVCDTFFSKLPNVLRWPSLSDLRAIVVEALTMHCDYDVDEAFDRLILPHLFKGSFLDPFNFPESLKADNLDALSDSFLEVCRMIDDY